MLSRLKTLSRRSVTVLAVVLFVVIAGSVTAALIMMRDSGNTSSSEVHQDGALPEDAVKADIGIPAGDILNETDRRNAEREAQ